MRQTRTAAIQPIFPRIFLFSFLEQFPNFFSNLSFLLRHPLMTCRFVLRRIGLYLDTAKLNGAGLQCHAKYLFYPQCIADIAKLPGNLHEMQRKLPFFTASICVDSWRKMTDRSPPTVHSETVNAVGVSEMIISEP